MKLLKPGRNPLGDWGRRFTLVAAVAGVAGAGPGQALATDTIAPISVQAQAAPIPRYSPGIREILKMLDAKVDPQVVRAYIQNSTTAYSLSAQDIIDLKQRGVPDDVLTSMMQHGAEVRARSMPAAQPYSALPLRNMLRSTLRRLPRRMPTPMPRRPGMATTTGIMAIPHTIIRIIPAIPTARTTATRTTGGESATAIPGTGSIPPSSSTRMGIVISAGMAATGLATIADTAAIEGSADGMAVPMGDAPAAQPGSRSAPMRDAAEAAPSARFAVTRPAPQADLPGIPCRLALAAEGSAAEADSAGVFAGEADSAGTVAAADIAENFEPAGAVLRGSSMASLGPTIRAKE